MTFLLATAVVASIVLWSYSTRGPRMALAVAWGIALLVPTWLCKDFGATHFDLRMAGMGTALGCLCLSSMRLTPSKWLLADFLVVALALSRIGSEYLAGEMGPSTVVDILRQWLAPYIFGRMAMQSVGDSRRLVAVAAVACLVLGFWSVGEAVTRINPVNLIFGHGGSMQAAQDVRWGLRRAEGPLTHPIYFGFLLVMMLPWALEAAQRSKALEGPRWWKYLPALMLPAVMCTMSRGPQIGALACLAGAAFFHFPAWRKRMALATVVLAVVGAGSYQAFLKVLQAWSHEESLQLVINGERYDYSGTNHRYLQFKVYEEAAMNAGYFGYGSKRMSTTPMDIPFVEEHLRWVFQSVDNHYLSFVLQSGYCGIAFFIALGLCALRYLYRPAMAAYAPESFLAGSLFSAIASVLLLLNSVWFSPDFGYLWLFSVGLAGSLRVKFDTEPDWRLAGAPAPAARSFVPQRRLVPGHPVLVGS